MTPGKRILVVEDEPLTAVALEQDLRELGYEVVGIAVRGTRALELARQRTPDLVLMDITLAGREDGVALAERLRTDLWLPVVFLTANTDAGTRSRAMLARPLAYLVKPYQAEALGSALHGALEGSRAGARA